MSYLQTGNRNQANTDLLKAIELDPYNPKPYFNMASFFHTDSDTLIDRANR